MGARHALPKSTTSASITRASVPCMQVSPVHDSFFFLFVSCQASASFVAEVESARRDVCAPAEAKYTSSSALNAVMPWTKL